MKNEKATTVTPASSTEVTAPKLTGSIQAYVPNQESAAAAIEETTTQAGGKKVAAPKAYVGSDISKQLKTIEVNKENEKVAKCATLKRDWIKKIGLSIRKKDIAKVVAEVYPETKGLLTGVYKVTSESIIFDVNVKAIVDMSLVNNVLGVSLADNQVIDRKKINLGKMPFDIGVFENKVSKQLETKVIVSMSNFIIYVLGFKDTTIGNAQFQFVNDSIMLSITTNPVHSAGYITFGDNVKIVLLNLTMKLDEFHRDIATKIDPSIVFESVSDLENMYKRQGGLMSFLPPSLILENTFLATAPLPLEYLKTIPGAIPGLSSKTVINKEAIIADYVPTLISKVDHLVTYLKADDNGDYSNYFFIYSLDRLADAALREDILKGYTDLRTRKTSTKLVLSNGVSSEKIIVLEMHI